MSRLKDFIEVTALSDNRKAVIRAEDISAVFDNAEEKGRWGKKPECRTIIFSGGELDVVESMEEICGMMYDAEF